MSAHDRPSSFVTVDGGALKARCAALLERLGVAAADADVTADVFCQSEMMGEESHGIRLFLLVLERLRAGGDRAATRISVVRDHGAIALWDGQRSLGQVSAARAMAAAIDKARRYGIGFVAVRNANSLTSAKYYPLMAADAGMIGCAFTNTSRKLMPAPGGAEPVIGNNPVAYAAPAGRFGAFVLDMACTKAAVERIVKAREDGQSIPSGWALDADGNDTTDPSAALASLALLPFGGYKAFGLAMVHEMLTSIVAGGELFAGDSTGFAPYDGAMNTSFSLLAIDVAAFRDRSAFEAEMEHMIERIKGSRRRDPNVSILYPGERSQSERARRRGGGVPLAAATLAKLDAWAQTFDLAPIGTPSAQPEGRS